MVIFRKSGGNL